MADIASISTAIATVKTAIEITKTINNIDKDLEKSELKQRIVELREALFTANNNLLDIKEIIQEKDEEIDSLKKQLENKNNFQPDLLPNECIQVLKILANKLDPPISQNIALSLEIPIPKAEYFLDILKSHSLLECSFNIRLGEVYSLNKNSRKFLAERNLI